MDPIGSQTSEPWCNSTSGCRLASLSDLHSRRGMTTNIDWWSMKILRFFDFSDWQERPEWSWWYQVRGSEDPEDVLKVKSCFAFRTVKWDHRTLHWCERILAECIDSRWNYRTKIICRKFHAVRSGIMVLACFSVTSSQMLLLQMLTTFWRDCSLTTEVAIHWPGVVESCCQTK